MKSIWLYGRHTLLFSVSLSLSTSGKLFLSTAVRLSMDAPSFCVSWNHSLSSGFPHTLPCPTLALTIWWPWARSWSSSVTPSRPSVLLFFSEWGSSSAWPWPSADSSLDSLVLFSMWVAPWMSPAWASVSWSPPQPTRQAVFSDHVLISS